MKPKKLLLKKLLLKKLLLKKHQLKKKRKINSFNIISVAKFGKTHGLKGEIRVNSFCNPVENILNYKKFYLKDGSGIQIDFLNSAHPY
ncbi:MAG: hypothetical protein ACPGE6_00670, partial [Gammaproteobacteria bacterium]